MKQPSLFDQQLARACDPWTSQAGAASIEHKQNAMAGHMLQAFKVRAMTANEAALYCVQQLGGNQESYRKRYGELLKACLIREAGTRKCGVTKRTATVYRFAL